MSIRSTHEVLADHLRNRRSGQLETDLARNYANDVVLLTCYGVFHGHDGVRKSAEILHRKVPDAEYEYVMQLHADQMAYLEWTAEGDGVTVSDGVDSFLIRDGLIRVQTIHYRPIEK